MSELVNNQGARKEENCRRCPWRAVDVTRRQRNDGREVVGATPSADYVQRLKIKWFGHVMRTEPAKQALSDYNCRTLAKHKDEQLNQEYLSMTQDQEMFWNSTM